MQYSGLSPGAQLAYDTILRKKTDGVPSAWINVMEHSMIERFAGVSEGTYRKEPEETYLAFQKAIGACILDQWIPCNPLTMAEKGYKNREKGATTGAEHIEVDGVTIDSPESVVEHMESIAFPKLKKAAEDFNGETRVRQLIEQEKQIQDLFGPDILKTGYGFIRFPTLAYNIYGYVHYFMAYALYPDVIETHFRLQADYWVLHNTAAARAYTQADLPPLFRLDHDMADSKGTLVDVKSLDRIWFPHFERSIEPLVKAGVNLMWHCDGNLMDMVPRLIECGVNGFQGFQYEAGMDYTKICSMKDREGNSLHIKAGVSVTTTLPHGTPDEVKKELKFLAENGPDTGLFLGASSSVTPGVPYKNLKTLVEGFQFYREKK